MIPAWAFWSRDRGYPVSWQAYVMGMRGLALSTCREMLRSADCASVGMATEESRREWVRNLEPYAGL